MLRIIRVFNLDSHLGLDTSNLITARIEYNVVHEPLTTMLFSYGKLSNRIPQFMNADNTSIRQIQKSDNPQVAELIRQVMTEFGCVGPGYSINDPEVDNIFRAYQGDRHRFWVIENDGKILGCGGIGLLVGADSTVCELKKMYFYPELRGQGWGRRLIEICLQTAREFGYQKCYLETVERMTSAIGLYLKNGFSRLDSPLGNTGHCSCEAHFALDL